MDARDNESESLVEKDTVSTYFVEAAVARLEAPARRRALAVARIPEGLPGVATARVPAASFAALWLAVARELDDEFFGLDRRAMRVGSFSLLCQALVGTAHLDHAIRRMLRGFAVFLDDVRGELLVDRDEATIRIANRVADPAARQFADETYLILVHGLMCWLIGHRVVLRRAEFAHARPPHADEYTRMYSQHLAFGAASTAIHFDARLLSALVVRNEASLQPFLRTAPQSVFLKYQNEDSWTARLRRHLRDSPLEAGWPGFEAVAAHFDIVPTTLRRRLEAEGASFQGIKDQIRNDLAIDQLSHGDASVDEIGVRLGFHDASAFHRAFRRWNGIQPGEYRKRRAQDPG